MAFNLYNEYAERCLLGTAPNLSTASIKLLFVSAAYTFDQAHGFIDSIAEEARVMNPVDLPDRDCSAGVFRAADLNVVIPNGEDAVIAVIGFLDTGSEETSLLIFYDDQCPDLPFAGDGNMRQIRWNSGEGELFRLVRVAPIYSVED